MTFYEISGDIEVSIYGACDVKIGNKLKIAIKKAVYEVAKENGSFELDDIQVNIDNLEYEKQDE